MEYKEPKRTFEDTGFVNPAESYYVKLENIVNSKNQNLKTMVDKSRYFSIFAPRQSGKTTFFKGFARDLEKDPEYIFILLSFEDFSELRTQEFYTSIEEEMYSQLIDRLKQINCPQIDSAADYLKTHRLRNSRSFKLILRKLNEIIKQKKIVIFIDEFDGIPKQEIFSFLTTLRKLYQEYKDKDNKALYSVGIVGIRNVAKLSVKGVSPFNIADHIELTSFNLKNIRDLYGQYTKETNQPFTEEAMQKVFEETGGQPWLVSRLANILTKKIKPETVDPITLEDVNKAIDILLNEPNDHFENLLEKLSIYKNTFFEIAYNNIVYDPNDSEQSWLRQYGLMKHIDKKTFIANEIYRKRFCSEKILQDHIDELSKPKPHIFLCHAKEDINHVRHIYERLKNAGFHPWLDEMDILPGQNWNLEIQKAINKTDFALIFLSEISVAKRGYVNKEIKWAIDRQSEKLDDDIFLVPVKIEECEMPQSLSCFQAVDLHGLEGVERIIRTIKSQFKKNNQTILPSAINQKKKIFISYCNEDEQWLEMLLPYLEPLEYEEIEYWYDKQNQLNNDWDTEIQNAVEDSQIFICLISKNYLVSEFIRKKELPEILNKNKEGRLIIPVIVTQCAWKTLPWLKKLQMFPKDSVPLNKKNEEEQEEILINIVNDIGEILC